MFKVEDMVEWLQEVGYAEGELMYDCAKYSEVIGNVYENPELIS